MIAPTERPTRLSPAAERALWDWLTAYDLFLAVEYERMPSTVRAIVLFAESERLWAIYQEAVQG